jgi:hypothetical protein
VAFPDRTVGLINVYMVAKGPRTVPLFSVPYKFGILSKACRGGP